MTQAVALYAPRLPYNPALESEYGVGLPAWKALTEAVWPAARTPEAIELALAYCKARNLDPMKRPVHIVPVWSTALGKMVEGVWPGISELRTTAMRTKQYAGCRSTVFGPLIEHTFRSGFKMSFPEWAQKTVFKLVGGQMATFEGPEVYWLETYATAKKDTDTPNAMWLKRPRGQLDKCAEAAALRMAFPEELGDEPTAEEMHGKTLDAVDLPEPVRNVRVLHAEFDPPAQEAPPSALAPPPEPEAEDAEFADIPDVPEAPAILEAGRPPPAGFDVVAWAVKLNRDLDGYAGVEVLRLDWREHEAELKAANPSMWKELNKNVSARGAALTVKAAA